MRSLDWSQDWYLGKPSIDKPLEIIDRDSPDMKVATLSAALNNINIPTCS